MAKDIEKFKVDLRLAAFEHETKFLKLHEQRVEVVAEIYQRLVRTESAFKYFVKPFVKVGEPPIEEKEKDTYEAAKLFSEYFNENRLWLDANTCSKIEEFDKKLLKAWNAFHIFIPGGDQRWMTEGKMEKWDKIWNEASVILPSIKRDIEDEFRNLLGGKRDS